MPPVQRRSRLLTASEIEERIANTDFETVQEAAAEPPANRPAPDNETLLAKAAGGEAAADVRHRRFYR